MWKVTQFPKFLLRCILPAWQFHFEIFKVVKIVTFNKYPFLTIRECFILFDNFKNILF